jgi:TolA-binding protein
MRKQLPLIILLGFVFLSILADAIFLLSKPSDKEYMEIASENMKNGDVSEAIVSYENVVEKYPQSELAPEALVKEATLYQSNMVTNISKEESLRKAAEIFYSVAGKYPSSEEAPKSLFMSGFIYANELQDYDKATKAYKLFMEKYPKHDLFASAKDELENMGLSPDEILKKKTASREK